MGGEGGVTGEGWHFAFPQKTSKMAGCHRGREKPNKITWMGLAFCFFL